MKEGLPHPFSCAFGSKLGNKDGPVLVFDLDTTGHHTTYLRYLLQYWKAHSFKKLVLIVGHNFPVYDELEVSPPHIVIVRVAPEQRQLPHFVKRMGRFPCALWTCWLEWRLLNFYAKQWGASHCMVMYMDLILYGPLALHFPLHCEVSGIYFRPAFHYGPLGWTNNSRREQIRSLRQRCLLGSALRHERLRTVFCLDPYAVGPINQLTPHQKAVFLPDPVESTSSAGLKNARRTLISVEADRRVLLFFGYITRRKGIGQLLSALKILPDDIARRSCLLLAGKIDPAIENLVTTGLAELSACSPLQVISHASVVPEPQVMDYFFACDIVLCPYQHHVGMSGVLLRAAISRRPVIVSNYGLLGAFADQHKLGIAIDADSPIQIANAISKLVRETPMPMSDTAVRTLEQQYSASNFCKTILKHITESH
ncbi:MAG: glycosyltransferase [Myxococcales bacterium]|nr:glycosyltransferase [Myxococcales bacterium]